MGWASAERRAERQTWFRRQHWIVRWAIIMSFAAAGALWGFLIAVGAMMAGG